MTSSDDRDSKPANAATTVEVLHPPNLLKIRASAPGGKTLDEMVTAGNSVVSTFAQDYSLVAEADILEIDGIAAAMRQAPLKADDFKQELMRVALNLKGQAATMGYPLVTEVATSLTDFLDDMKKASRRLADDPKTALPAVQFHVEALRILMAKNVTGRGGETEQALVEALKRIVAKALPEKPA